MGRNKPVSLEEREAIRARFIRDGATRDVSVVEVAAEFKRSVSTIRRIMFARHRAEITPETKGNK